MNTILIDGMREMHADLDKRCETMAAFIEKAKAAGWLVIDFTAYLAHMEERRADAWAYYCELSQEYYDRIEKHRQGAFNSCCEMSGE